MDFRELNYVLAIAEHQNITKAAESLYVSQPTLSKFLISLEHELDVKLFRRNGYKYVLTYAGECYVSKARQILQLKRELDAELTDIVKNDRGTLSVGFASMRCSYLLPAVLPLFRQRHPNVSVEVSEGLSATMDSQMMEGKLELAFYSKPPEAHPQLEYELLAEEELLLCVQAGHPVSRMAQSNPGSPYPRLNPELLQDETLLRMTAEQRTGQFIDDYLKKEHITFRSQLCTSSMPSIMELVASGYGVSFLFEPHVKNFASRDRIDLYSFGRKRVTSHFVAAYRKGSYLSDYAREFIDIVRQLNCPEP